MFIDRHEGGERVLLVVIHDRLREDAERQEFESLATASGAVVCGCWEGLVTLPRSATYVGKGQLDEIRLARLAADADLIIVNQDLSPAQERNIERELECRVLGRTGLILDLFAARARTAEGKLQVELAQLRHLSTRLVRGWSHLDRQKGGIGLRGAGEKQLELDQRLIKHRISRLLRQLGEVKARRGRNRQTRRRAGLPVVALVGYTNAGKSTLFNRLTGADVFAADQLFATLDPTLRRIRLPDFGDALLADTVGFISRLPHRLVDAFRATLEEVADADLLLHVIDGSDARWPDHVEAVEAVLSEIDALDVPRLDVFNKADLCDAPAGGPSDRCWISAQAGTGLDALQARIVDRLAPEQFDVEARLAVGAGRLRSELHERRRVRAEHVDDDGCWRLSLRLEPEELERLRDRDDVLALVALPRAVVAESSVGRAGHCGTGPDTADVRVAGVPGGS